MSENIQSISQGTYTIGQTSANDSSLLVTQNKGEASILSTQQEISHDNTLSGNGTVDSPLGVVPGYNETVLWSGNSYTGTFSENISAFEKIQFHMKDDTCIVGIGTLYTDDIFSNGNYIVGCGASVWQPKSSPVRILSVSGNLTGFNSTNVSYQWWSKNDGGYASFNVTKVVGINRIAHN